MHMTKNTFMFLKYHFIPFQFVNRIISYLLEWCLLAMNSITILALKITYSIFSKIPFVFTPKWIPCSIWNNQG